MITEKEFEELSWTTLINKIGKRTVEYKTPEQYCLTDLAMIELVELFDKIEGISKFSCGNKIGFICGDQEKIIKILTKTFDDKNNWQEFKGWIQEILSKNI